MNNANQCEITMYSSKQKECVIDLIVHIQQHEFGIAITANDQPDLRTIPTFYQQGKGNFWVAGIDNTVIGTIALLDMGNEQAALRKMFVNREYRGATFNVAPKLLETLLSWAQSTGLRTLYLGTTPVFLAAHRFYEKHGFEEISKASLPAAFPIMKVDTKFYKYTIEHGR